MAVTLPNSRTERTLADLVRRLGSVSLERIAAHPAPGAATETDLLAALERKSRLFELLDGVLVEKPRGYYEALVAAILIRLLGSYVEQHDLGIVLGADATLRLAPGVVRLPDVSFISWQRFPGRRLPAGPILDLAPDLAVEVLSERNTSAEMDRKLREYFAGGTRLVWLVDPTARTARAYTNPDTFVSLSEDGVLDGGEVIPGFRLGLRDWLDRAGERKTARQDP